MSLTHVFTAMLLHLFTLPNLLAVLIAAAYVTWLRWPTAAETRHYNPLMSRKRGMSAHWLCWGPPHSARSRLKTAR